MSYQSFLRARRDSGPHNLMVAATLATSLQLGVTFAEAEQLNTQDELLAREVIENRNTRVKFQSQSKLNSK